MVTKFQYSKRNNSYCTISAAGKTANEATITYIISSSFSNSAITLTKIFAEGFKDFELGGNSQIIIEENVKELSKKYIYYDSKKQKEVVLIKYIYSQ